MIIKFENKMKSIANKIFNEDHNPLEAIGISDNDITDIYTCYLKGKDILSAIEQSIYNQINPNVTERVGGLIQTTGLQFSYTYNSSYGNYLKNANVCGQPLEINKYYRTVMNQLMIEGGHKYESLKNAVNVQKLPFNDMSLIEKCLDIYSPLCAYSQGWSIPVSKEDYKRGKKECFPI